MRRNKIYVGHTSKGDREVFRSVDTPTASEYGKYGYVTGHFRTARAAKFFARNSDIISVADAERLSRGRL